MGRLSLALPEELGTGPQPQNDESIGGQENGGTKPAIRRAGEPPENDDGRSKLVRWFSCWARGS